MPSLTPDTPQSSTGPDADQKLGMGRRITRRDFINGVALVGASATTRAASPDEGASFAGQSLQAAAPMHALRDGRPHPELPTFTVGGEQYDLVVVGAGISGLTAAHLYRQHAGPEARILVLEAASDVGGHAVRNEFVSNSGRRLIGYGGSEALDSP